METEPNILNNKVYVNNRPISRNDYLGKNEIEFVIPKPDQEIFLYPVVTIGSNSSGPYISEEHVTEFYSVVNIINARKINSKQCYTVKVLMRKAASSKHVMQKGCDIIFIIGHGDFRNGEEYIKLTDGLFRIRKIKQSCIPIGCYVGDNRGRQTTHVGMIKLLTEKLKEYATTNECPGKIICVYSGPLH